MSKQHAVFIIFELLSLSSHSNILIFLRISQNSREKKAAIEPFTSLKPTTLLKALLVMGAFLRT